MLVTAFVARHGDGGPPVTAERRGTSWHFTWVGKVGGNTSSGLVNCPYQEAVRIATELAERVADLEPYRLEVVRRQEDLAEWLDQQREPEG